MRKYESPAELAPSAAAGDAEPRGKPVSDEIHAAPAKTGWLTVKEVVEQVPVARRIRRLCVRARAVVISMGPWPFPATRGHMMPGAKTHLQVVEDEGGRVGWRSGGAQQESAFSPGASRHDALQPPASPSARARSTEGQRRGAEKSGGHSNR